MKSLLVSIVAAVLLVGCGESQQSAPPAEVEPVEPVAEVPAQPSPTPVEAKSVEPVVEAAKPPTAKAPDISIHDAAEDGNIEVVKQHIAAGTDVNAMNNERKTPLHDAAREGNKEVAELLIAKGADVNAKDIFDGTPLHYSVRNVRYGQCKEIVELLIAEGANVNATFKVGSSSGGGGETPLDEAIQRKHPETAALLRKHGGKTGVELSIHTAAAMGDTEAVKQHLAAGADVNAKGDRGYIPLHMAANGGQKEIAELLIAEGADVNARNANGGIPLHQAAVKGHKEIVELLIAKGADVNAKVASGPKQGLTPLDAANETNHPETADILRKHGGKTGEELEAEGN